MNLSARGKLNSDETIDALLELLIMSYELGVTDTNDDLFGNTIPTQEQMYQALYERVKDKDFVDRAREYANQDDVASIMRVAETDALRCYNAGAYDTAKLNGATTKTWVAVMDEKTRDTHWYLDGTTVGIDDYFYSISGDKAKYPHQFETAEENCNCRCIATYNK